MSGCRLVERAPSVRDYNRVRVAAGLSAKDPTAAETGLSNTVFGVRVEADGAVVGIGRIVGDGALFFEVVDVAVLPEHQGKGLGAMVMDALMGWLRENTTPGAFVSLISDKGVSAFYERYGFAVRPPGSPGMSQVIR